MKLKSSYWDYEIVYENMKHATHRSRKNSLTDVPVPVVMFREIPVSLYGSALEFDDEPNSVFTHRNIDFKTFGRYDPKKQERYRAVNGRMVLIFPGELTRKGQFIIAIEHINGEFEPIVEVADAGRGQLRCRQFAQLLHLAFVTDEDVLAISETRYRDLLTVIGTNRLL